MVTDSPPVQAIGDLQFAGGALLSEIGESGSAAEDRRQAERRTDRDVRSTSLSEIPAGVQFYRPEPTILAVSSSAARSPRASFAASSLAQK
jgi:hypothetical protein